MILESDFTGDSLDDAVAAGSHVVSTRGIFLSVLVLRIQGLYLPSKLDFFAFGGENDIFGSYLSLQAPHFPASEYLPNFFPEMPQGAPSIPGAPQTAPQSVQIFYEPSTSQLPIVGPSHNTVRIRVLFSSLNSQC